MVAKIEPIPEDDLYRMYWDERMSTPEIAKRVSVSYSTIFNLMKKYNMPKRTRSEAQFGHDVVILSEDELRQMYWDKKMTMPEIAKLVGVSDMTIHNSMKKYNIPTRTQSEAHILIDNRGPNSPHWKGGPKKYCYKFSQRFREAVRERDDYTCQNCGFEQKLGGKKLSVHHIHYDAENCYPDVISLCHSCHMSSNGNRDAWETHYWCILAERGLLEWEPPWAEERDENDT